MSRDINDLLSKAQSSYSSLASSYVANEDDKKRLAVMLMAYNAQSYNAQSLS